ncbi:sialoadhesin-like isoform X2 [Danio aesculapii]|uniref:sialoadhesin-like isoform X2 n=1 Tax=Danio aesculapii TaxID=1142201 RepID=UPI0024BFE4A5|nr:sialoadhesin-like isoform X2 [Danio aesculapii]
MLQFLLFLLPVAGAAGVAGWGVNYSRPICAARGSTVTVACNFTFPLVNEHVKQVKWCSMNSNYKKCDSGPYVYDSEANNNSIRFQYIGDKASDCSLLINDIQLTDSGEYKFRFITNSSGSMWTGDPGVIISVYDLKVSKSNSIINGIIPGDSVNLTCSLDCPGGLSEVQWFKNGELMKQTNPILILNGLPAENSGNYSCSLRKFTNPLSGETLLIIVVSSVLLVFIIIVAVILIRRRKAAKEREEPMDSHYASLQITAATQASAVYSSLQDTLKE